MFPVVMLMVKESGGRVSTTMKTVRVVLYGKYIGVKSYNTVTCLAMVTDKQQANINHNNLNSIMK